MEVCVVGTGYVGLVTGTCLAYLGHSVVCVDIDERKIEMLRSGRSPIYEPGLDQLIARETNLPIHVDEEPLTCVVRGAGRILDDINKYRGVLTT